MSDQNRLPRPKAFVALPTDENGRPRSISAVPVFHDGRHSTGLISGEVRCTLTALTPLLVANDQYEVGKAKGARPLGNRERPAGDGETTQKVSLPSEWNLVDDQGRPLAFASDKKILEPLRLRDGRVVFSGTGLKGMLSASLGALLGSPMSRVRERAHFYRPNQVFKSGAQQIREGRPAVIEEYDSATDTVRLRILPSAAMSEILFVRDKARKLLPTAKNWANQGKTVAGVVKNNRRLDRGSGSADLAEYLYFSYSGTMDGEARMAGLFNQQMKRGPAFPYRCILVHEKYLRDDVCWVTDVPQSVLRLHELTVSGLSDDVTGHLRGEHPQTHLSGFKANKETIVRGIRRGREAVRTPGNLIYVEVQLDDRGKPSQINTIGHNYYYLSRKIDTVTTAWTGTDWSRRAILSPLPEEAAIDPSDAHSPPQRLSAQRGLFGYVVDTRNPGATGIGTGDFRQFAGRLGFNIAVEVVPEGVDPQSDRRFLNADRGCVVPLKVLGPPRSSDESGVIQQNLAKERSDNAKRVGYGEVFEDPRGELKGRGFYVHQPDAAHDKSLYTADLVTEQDVVSGNQAALARFVSRPGTQFRVALRFQDLRDWELGAILTCLRPGLLKDPDGALQEPGAMSPSHAIKLGHGRPLGMGSVRVDIDEICLIDMSGELRASENVATDVIEAFVKIDLDSRVRREWTNVHRFDGRHRAAYPSATDRNGQETVVAHYSRESQEHARSRRELKGAQRPPKGGGMGGGHGGKRNSWHSGGGRKGGGHRRY